MKLFSALLISAAVVPPVALGQQVRFTVGDASPPNNWAINAGAVNSIDVGFSLAGNDPTFFSYTVDQSGCGENMQVYSQQNQMQDQLNPDWLANNIMNYRSDNSDMHENGPDVPALIGIGGSSGSVAQGITVQFTNPGPVIESFFCFTVNLLFSSNPDPVHSKTFLFDVTANENGEVTGVTTSISAENLQVVDAGSAFVETRSEICWTVVGQAIQVETVRTGFS